VTFLLVFGGWAAASVAVGAVLGMWRTRLARLEAIARACHELRGSLTAARLGLELGRGRGELTAARLRAVDLELARASLALDDLESTRVSMALDDLDGGDAPRCQAVGVAEYVDMSELVADSVEAWRAAGARAAVQLVARWCGPPARVAGDRIRLAQATDNLIANAIEHGGGVVEVRGRMDDGVVRIEVRDTGPGLPAPVATLTRHANRNRGRRGHGLAIAAGIAAGHGGRLGAAPSECGATLVLELPLATGSGQVQLTPTPDR